MNERQPQPDAQLFSIRLWTEDLGHSQAEWRGQVRLLPNGETRYFREWTALVAFLQSTLPQLDISDHESASEPARRQGGL